MKNSRLVSAFHVFACFSFALLLVSCKKENKSKAPLVETYSIIFDEIRIYYHGLTVPKNVRDYNVCFEAKSGTQTKSFSIEKKLGNFLPEHDSPTPIPLKGLKLENVLGTEGCTIHIGLDGILSKACTDAAEVSFPLKIQESDFNYFKGSHGAAYMPLFSDRSNIRFDVIYRIEKANK